MRPLGNPSASRTALFLAVTLVVFAGSLEIGFRLFADLPRVQDDGFFRYAEDFDLAYEPRENAEIQFHEGEVTVVYRTNGAALRGTREYAVPKPAGVCRICVVGDSVSFQSTGAVYSEFLQDELDGVSTEECERFEVLNFAVIGYDSRQEAIVLRDRVGAFEPDAIILGYCFNDTEYTDGLGGLPRAMHPKSVGRRIHSHFVTFLEHRMHRYLHALSEGRVDFDVVENLFAMLRQRKRGRGIAVLVLAFPLFSDAGGIEYVGVDHVHHMARGMGLDAISARKMFGGSDTRRFRLTPDDNFHLNEAGHRHVADAVLPWVKETFAIAEPAPPDGDDDGS